MFYSRAYNCNSEEINRLLCLSDEDVDYDFIDDPDYEHEYIEEDYHHSSDSAVTLESGDDSVENEDENNLRFFIGKDGETLWSNNAVSTRPKIKSKNIVKIFPGPKVIVRQCKTPLEYFLQIIISEMITNIVKYTNIFIIKKLSENQPSRERDYKLINQADIMGLLGSLFLIAVKKGNRSNASEFWTKNGTGLMILRASFSLHRFYLLMRSLRFDDINSRNQRL